MYWIDISYINATQHTSKQKRLHNYVISQDSLHSSPTCIATGRGLSLVMSQCLIGIVTDEPRAMYFTLAALCWEWKNEQFSFGIFKDIVSMCLETKSSSVVDTKILLRFAVKIVSTYLHLASSCSPCPLSKQDVTYNGYPELDKCYFTLLPVWYIFICVSYYAVWLHYYVKNAPPSKHARIRIFT